MSLVDRNRLLSFVLGLTAVVGLGCSVFFFLQPSESGNQFLLGLSLARFLIGVLFLSAVAGVGVTAIVLSKPDSAWNGRISNLLASLFASGTKIYFAVTLLYGVALLSGSALILVSLRLVERYAAVIGFFSRLNVLLFWLLFSSVALLLFFLRTADPTRRQGLVFSPVRTVAWIWIFLLAYIFVVAYYRESAYLLTLKRFETPLLLWGGFVSLWALLVSGTFRKQNLSRLLLLLGIFFTALIIYLHVASWIGWIHKGRYEYWNVLAGQFIEGRLYVPTPEKENLTHDLTFHDGHWYVPNPPLPAIIIIPLAFFLPAEEIHMGDVSMVFSAVNAVLVFLILDKFRQRQWLKISNTVVLWLVALFFLGTNHVWVGINGGVWFFSQVLTVTCLGGAVLSAINGWSPLWVGLGLALAIGARPNSLMTWPFVFAIAMQVQQEAGSKVGIREWIGWSLKSAVPIMLAVGGLLYYNFARFGNFLDFGYTTINGDVTIVQNAQDFGLFSPRYILRNLEVMFMTLPKLQWGEAWFILPSRLGFSMFVSTPALFYLFRRYDKKWWILGAWAAIILNIVLLILYHNTGSDQFGYRYILDFILPVLVLMAAAFEKELPWHFFVLWLYSVIVNIYGAAFFVLY